MSPQIRRLALDLGPLLIFFATFKIGGFFTATAAFMVAIVAALVIGYVAERKLSPMPIFTCAMVLVFGGLTLHLKNEAFLKVKVTIIYAIFGVVLLAGLAAKRLFIKYVFAQAFELDDAGWRKLTVHWGLFFLALAILNEAIWRNFATEVWIYAKFGMIGLTFLFALAQTPLVIKHQIPNAETGEKTQE